MNILIRVSQYSFFLLILLIQACGGGGSSSGGGNADNSDSVRSIVTIGDSIGVGVGFGSSTPWPNVLARTLGVPLLENRSRKSQKTDWGLAQINGLLDRHKPSHVVILMGTNDARGGSVGGAVASLQQMADIANSKGVIPVIGTVILNQTSAIHDSRAQQISAGIRGIQGARIADTRGAISGALLADGIHPNDAGQQAIANAFADAF